MADFRCPRCGAESDTNRFGDITDQNTAQNHPWMAIKRIRICRPSYHGLVRLEHADADDLAAITIATR